MNFEENLANNNKFLNIHFQKIKSERNIKWISHNTHVTYITSVVIDETHNDFYLFMIHLICAPVIVIYCIGNGLLWYIFTFQIIDFFHLLLKAKSLTLRSFAMIVISLEQWVTRFIYFFLFIIIIIILFFCWFVWGFFCPACHKLITCTTQTIVYKKRIFFNLQNKNKKYCRLHTFLTCWH